jgi:hypothetical protein
MTENTFNEETGNHSPLHQVEELWKQWYDTSSKVWSDTLAGASTSYGDPYGLYRSWLQTLENGSQNADTTSQDAPSNANPTELWKQWIEMTSQAWRQSFATNSDPFGLTTRWLEMMEETRLNLLRETAIPNDPFTFFKQWYESSHEAWSKSIEEIIGNDKFVEAASRYMESYTTFYKNFSRLNEDYFSHLQLATRSDLTRIAELIIALENKVDTLQDTSEELQSHYPLFATLAAIQPLTDHLQSLVQRVSAIEQDTHLEKRLDSVEQKLDTLITLFTQANAHQPAAATKINGIASTSNTKTRKAPKTPKKVSEETPPPSIEE